VPPLDKLTGFSEFMPSEAGYDEVRRVFDYLRSVGLVGPKIATHETPGINGHAADNNGTTNGHPAKVEICVVDADDLLDNPKGIIEAYCNSVGIPFDKGMLIWDSEEDQKQAKEAFEKWPGFHEDAMNSCDLKPRLHVSGLATSFLILLELTILYERRSSPRVRKSKTASGFKSLERKEPRSSGRMWMPTLKLMSTSSSSH